jgi:hypothetical protein
MEVSCQLHALGRFTPSTNYIRDWMGPRADMDIAEERNISCLFWISNPDLRRPARGWLLYWLNLCRLFVIFSMDAVQSDCEIWNVPLNTSYAQKMESSFWQSRVSKDIGEEIGENADVRLEWKKLCSNRLRIVCNITL